MSASEPTVPCRCLVPDEVAELIADGSVPTLTLEEETPDLSDRIVTLSGTVEEQEAACRHVLLHLRDAFSEADNDQMFFVVVVPTAAAGAVIGTKGQKVRMLVERSGASIDVSREVIPGLQAQPVTISGTIDQVVNAVAGVQEVLQQLRLREDLAAPPVADPKPSMEFLPSSAVSVTSESFPPASPMILLMSMGAVGWVIGKQGRHVAELQRRSGARISLVAGCGDLPGMRCGDRLMEINGADWTRLSEGVSLVFAAVAEASQSRECGTPGLLVPESALGYVIGKGGKTIREVAERFGVDVSLDNDGPAVAGGRVAVITGSPAACGEAALALHSKVAELRTRQQYSAGSADYLAAPASVAAPATLPLVPPTLPPASAPEQIRRPPQATWTHDQAASTAVGPPPGMHGGACAQAAYPASSAAPLPAMSGAGTLPPGAGVAPTAEQAVLAGLQASGVLNHRLAISVPRHAIPALGLDDISRQSGARFEIAGAEAGTETANCFVAAVGPRLATSIAVLHLQERMAKLGVA
eukprot:TRINITY_DN24334_c0_g1_i1.p1 TRINITY_DN24334_c0_g1~~TRINITY_DN24334_c0_g1_i1.p1  ORF type:complete len:536 (-),score=102.51 TRINITY_DN24334_c0_g1_i1:194-1774(-)